MAFNYYNLAYLVPLISVIIILVVIMVLFPLSINRPNISSATSVYTVTFSQVGLPAGVQWGVNLDGHQLNSSGNQDQITVTNIAKGNHLWTSWSIPCGNECEYTPTQLTGSLDVPGQLFQTIHFIKQYKVTVVSLLIDNPSSNPELYYMDLGSQNRMQLVNASIWADANSFWYVSPTFIQGSNAEERWITNETGGIILGPRTLSIVYYHQFLIKYDTITSDNSLLPTPVYLTGEAFGSTFVQPMSMGSYQLWMDSGENWTVTSTINGISSHERWVLHVPSTGTVKGTATVTLPYLHQYYLEFSVFPQHSGSINVSDGWFNAGKLTISASPSIGFSFYRWYTDSPSTFIFDQYSQVTDVTVHGTSNITAFFSEAGTSTSNSFSQVIQKLIAFTVEVSSGGYINYSYGQTKGFVAQASITTLSVPSGSLVCLTANPLPGYSFTGWNNTSLGNSNTYCVVVYSTMTIQAIFSPSGSTVGGTSGEGTGTQSVPEFTFGSFPAIAITFLLLLFLSSRIKKKPRGI